MKARFSLYAPNMPRESLPDIAALRAQYTALIATMKCLAIIGDFSGVLKTSAQIARTVKALLKGRAQIAARARKAKMLADAPWRARVVSDLGGRRKLIKWQASMCQAITRSANDKPLARPPVISAGPAAIAALAKSRETMRKSVKASAHPNIYKDPFRVDQEGQFRLPPIPRMPGSIGASHQGRAPAAPGDRTGDYIYDPRKVNKMTDLFAPVAIWPAEIFAAERPARTLPPRAPAFVLGSTPGRHRRPERLALARRTAHIFRRFHAGILCLSGSIFRRTLKLIRAFIESKRSKSNVIIMGATN